MGAPHSWETRGHFLSPLPQPWSRASSVPPDAAAALLAPSGGGDHLGHPYSPLPRHSSPALPSPRGPPEATGTPQHRR